jgi:HEAT repeat protein
VRAKLGLEEFLFGADEVIDRGYATVRSLGAVAEPALRMALSSGNARRIELALDGLAELGSPYLYPSIVALQRSSDGWVRLLALHAAQRLPEDEARRFLVAGARDEAPEVRRRVVSYLSWRQAGWAVEVLQQLAADRDEKVQTAAMEALTLCLDGLAKVETSELIGALKGLSQDVNAKVRQIAIRAAQRLRDDEARPFLVAATGDPVPAVRRRVISYLSWRQSSWATAELRRLCDDDEAEIRWAALEALATAQPSEAKEILGRIPEGQDRLFRLRVVNLLKQHSHETADTDDHQQEPQDGAGPGGEPIATESDSHSDDEQVEVAGHDEDSQGEEGSRNNGQNGDGSKVARRRKVKKQRRVRPEPHSDVPAE